MASSSATPSVFIIPALTRKSDNDFDNTAPSAKRRATGKTRTIAAVDAQAGKLDPVGQPEVWAAKRQALCEALPKSYKAYQSGAYTTDEKVWGLLIDKETSPRDKFEEQIIITRVGGGLKANSEGKMVQEKDQDITSTVRSFQKSMKDKQPVMMIAGQGNKLSPTRLPHYYNVLDWFHITDVWTEKLNDKTRWMVRLEKIYLNKQSWWAPAQPQFSYEEAGPSRSMATRVVTCSECNEQSKEIYNAGWTCLNRKCELFFNFPRGYNDETLDYVRAFLAERTSYTGNAPGPLAPALPTAEYIESIDGVGYEEACKVGIVCPECKCCTRRLWWSGWVCENDECDFSYTIPQAQVSIADVLRQAGEAQKAKKMPAEFYNGGITKREGICGPYTVSTYDIPGEDGEPIGFIRHFHASEEINEQEDGPNDLFHKVQESELMMKRNPVRQSGSSGEIVTSHWAANWGAPYKFGVKQISKSFAESPEAILKAVKRLTWAGQYAVAQIYEPFQDFNELLSIGYFEQSKIGFHDDGEKELGPTVATLSLGCPAMMSFKPKPKNSIAVRKNRSGKKVITKPTLLKIKLEHGDIMVMHGTKIQKLYDHSVTPHGLVRFALTSRYIRPEMMQNEADRQYAETAGQIPEGFTYVYDGGADII